MSNKKEKSNVITGCTGLNLEAVVRFDEKGQLVLPKDIRDKAGIKAGDKLAIISCGDSENICCLTIMKSDQLHGLLKDVMEPIFQGLGNLGQR